MILLGGIQMMVASVACLYIGRILAEVQGRPLFVVPETVGDHVEARLSAPPRADGNAPLRA